MLVKSKLMLIAGVLFAAGSFAACGSAGGTQNSGGNSNGCMPGASQACACVDGRMGAQVCSDDGKLGECKCSGTTSTNTGTGGTGSTTSNQATCGDGKIQSSDHCDNPASEFYCKVDCMQGMGGSGGMTTTSSTTTTSSSTDPCAGHVFYAGKFDGAGPVWGGLTQAMGATGLDAGNNVCKSLNIGADHVCDYEEVLLAQAQGELAAIPAGTTAWIQRTTNAMVGGVTSAPGPGGRCNNWTYNTNHISDGEYATFDTVGNPTYHLDGDTIFDPNQAGVHTVGDLPCGGATRSILCCYQACN